MRLMSGDRLPLGAKDLYNHLVFGIARGRAVWWGLFVQRVGRAVYIMRDCHLLSPERISIGNYVCINHGTTLGGHGSLTIGNYVNVGPNVSLLTANHRFDAFDRPMAQQGVVPAPVVVEDDVWLGANVVVLPGNRIGRGAIVGANAVVTHDVEPFAIVGGVPARLIRYRFDEATRRKAADITFDSTTAGG